MTLAALIPDAASAARRNPTWLDPAAQFKSAAPSAGASSFRCSPSAFSPPASEWNCLGAKVESDEQNGDRELARAA